MKRARLMLSLTVWAAGCTGPVLPPSDAVAPATSQRLQTINDDYILSVKPIFMRSCAHCHGSGNRLPWYHSVPFVRGMIDDDIARARRAMDMSHDFPFIGRGSPSEYLDAILEVIDEGSMPPPRFRAMHWSASFTAAERDTIRKWIDSSHLRLRATKL